MKQRKILSFLALILLCCLCFTGCAERIPEVEEGKFYIYYLDGNESRLYPVEAILADSGEPETQVETIWTNLTQTADTTEYASAVPTYVELRGFDLTDGKLTLDFANTYSDMSPRTEVLCRVACVRTYTQVEGIDTVQFTVNSQPLTYADGTAVGAQTADDFVDLVEKGINSVTRATLTLYFSDETGDYLVTQNMEVAYDSDYPLEQYVVNRLVQGPTESSGTAYPTLPTNLQVIQVTTTNGVCHVNLDDAFVRDALDVKAYIPVYSIVNSLTELPGINSVLISINGSSNVVFKDQISLQQPLSRSLDYVLGGN